jgi:hypothetical protein
MGAYQALINRRLKLAIEIAEGGVGLDDKARRLARPAGQPAGRHQRHPGGARREPGCERGIMSTGS